MKYIKLLVVDYFEASCGGPNETRLALCNGELCWEIGLNAAAVWLKLVPEILIDDTEKPTRQEIKTIVHVDPFPVCPVCASPKPNLHPAIQFEGEVEICIHDFHLQDIPENTERHKKMVHDKRKLKK